MCPESIVIRLLESHRPDPEFPDRDPKIMEVSGNWVSGSLDFHGIQNFLDFHGIQNPISTESRISGSLDLWNHLPVHVPELSSNLRLLPGLIVLRLRLLISLISGLVVLIALGCRTPISKQHPAPPVFLFRILLLLLSHDILDTFSSQVSAPGCSSSSLITNHVWFRINPVVLYRIPILESYLGV